MLSDARYCAPSESKRHHATYDNGVLRMSAGSDGLASVCRHCGQSIYRDNVNSAWWSTRRPAPIKPTGSI